jgi:hypothetical protein
VRLKSPEGILAFWLLSALAIPVDAASTLWGSTIMLGFLWLGACVAGFFWHSEAVDKAARKRQRECRYSGRLGRYGETEDEAGGGWACLALVALWIFVWQLPYGILPATTSWFEGSGYPY